MLNCLCFERPDEIGNCYKETQNRHTCLAGDVKTCIREVFRTMPNIYDRAFLRKHVMAKRKLTVFAKSSMKDVCQGPNYVSTHVSKKCV